MKKNINKIYILILGTIIALIPGYLIRYQEQVYMWLYAKFTTYPGDLWNFWVNYLKKQGAVYPPEYPAGLRFFYELMRFDKYQNYSHFFNVNIAILSCFAVGVTILLYLMIIDRSKAHESTRNNSRKNKIDRDPSTSLCYAQDDNLKANSKKRIANIWYFWIFAPSFIVYSFINYDLPVVFLIVLALYLFFKKKYYGAIASLAIGTVLKVFPIFLLPIFILKSPKKDWWKLGLVFGLIVVGLNLPYLIDNFSKWVFPYTWQIGQNLSKGPESGTYWWIFYNFFGDKIGWMSLGLFAFLYLFTWLKLKETSIINLCIAVILIFLFTDRIYSPQYNLYLLPFLVLAPYMVNKKAFYLLEIPNAIHILALFWLKEHVLWLQILVLLKYIAIVWLYIINYKQSLKSGVKEKYEKT